jgi:hypothetical protein
VSEKKQDLEPIEDTINRGKSNCCRITLAEDALKNQKARLDCLEKLTRCAVNGHKGQYTFYDGYICRKCTACGKDDCSKADFFTCSFSKKIFNKIKKLFKE